MKTIKKISLTVAAAFCLALTSYGQASLVVTNGTTAVKFDPPVSLALPVQEVQIHNVTSPMPHDKDAAYSISLSFNVSMKAGGDEDGGDGNMRASVSIAGSLRVTIDDRIAYLNAANGDNKLTRENYSESSVTTAQLQQVVYACAIAKFQKLYGELVVE